VQGFGDVLADRLRVLGDARPVAPVQLRDLLQDGNEAGAPEMIVLGRKVRPAEEHLPLGREERRERPAALSGARLARALGAGLHVGPLVAIALAAHNTALPQASN